MVRPVESQPAAAVIQTSAAGEMFKPQSNLKPVFLDKFLPKCGSVYNHLLQGCPTPACVALYEASDTRHMGECVGAVQCQDEVAKEIIDLLLEESELRNPLHNRRIDFLQSKRQ